jgi:hypothetical protein
MFFFACSLDEGGLVPSDGGGATGGTGGSQNDASWGDASGGSAGSSAGTAGTAGVSGASGASGVGGAGGGPPSPEGDCSDGQDGADQDGLIDCADDDCAATHRCAPKPPGGWQGPVAFTLGASPAAGCELSGGYPSEKYDLPQNTYPAATCSQCTCDAQPVTCPAPRVRSYANANCTSERANHQLTTPCTVFEVTGQEQDAVKLEIAPPTGNCAPSTVVVTLPPPMVTSHGRACGDATEGAGCGAELCVPRPAAPFAEICITREGDHACPNQYPVEHALALDYDDQRGCSKCSCGAASCSASITVYEPNDCSGTVLATANAHDQCAVLSTGQNGMSVGLTATGKTCPPSGGQSEGAVTPAPITVCCLPPG